MNNGHKSVCGVIGGRHEYGFGGVRFGRPGVLLFVCFWCCLLAPGVVPADTNFLAHYLMNDNAGSTTVLDNKGMYNGASVRNTSYLHVVGKLDGALSFNGSSDYVVCNIRSSSQISVGFWVEFDSLAVEQHMMEFINSNSSIHIGGWGDFSFGFALEGSDGIHSGIYPTANVWYHVVATYDKSEMKLYVNGGLAGTKSWNTGYNFGYIKIGQNLFGSLDDIRVYDRALTSDDVAAIWNGGSGTENDGLVGSNTVAVVADTNGTWQFVISNGVSGIQGQLTTIAISISGAFGSNGVGGSQAELVALMGSSVNALAGVAAGVSNQTVALTAPLVGMQGSSYSNWLSSVSGFSNTYNRLGLIAADLTNANGTAAHYLENLQKGVWCPGYDGFYEPCFENSELKVENDTMQRVDNDTLAKLDCVIAAVDALGGWTGVMLALSNYTLTVQGKVDITNSISIGGFDEASVSNLVTRLKPRYFDGQNWVQGLMVQRNDAWTNEAAGEWSATTNMWWVMTNTLVAMTGSLAIVSESLTNMYGSLTNVQSSIEDFSAWERSNRWAEASNSWAARSNAMVVGSNTVALLGWIATNNANSNMMSPDASWLYAPTNEPDASSLSNAVHGGSVTNIMGFFESEPWLNIVFGFTWGDVTIVPRDTWVVWDNTDLPLSQTGWFRGRLVFGWNPSIAAWTYGAGCLLLVIAFWVFGVQVVYYITHPWVSWSLYLGDTIGGDQDGAGLELSKWEDGERGE